MENKFPVPNGLDVSEKDLDYYTRQYLQTLVDNKLVVSCSFFDSNTLEKENQKYRNVSGGMTKIK